MTVFEKLIWFQLKGKQLDGYKFRRQAPIGPYIADFYAPSVRLVVEIDGPIHDERQASDADRTSYLESRVAESFDSEQTMPCCSLRTSQRRS